MKTKLLAVAASTVLGMALTSGTAYADSNPFEMKKLDAGFSVAMSDEPEAKCGGDKAKMDGKCGGDKAKKDGKCGGEKTMEGKCGGDKTKMEGKCGGQ